MMGIGKFGSSRQANVSSELEFCRLASVLSTRLLEHVVAVIFAYNKCDCYLRHFVAGSRIISSTVR